MSNKTELVDEFCNVTGAQREIAEFYLESSKWDLDTATSFYLAEVDQETQPEPLEPESAPKNFTTNISNKPKPKSKPNQGNVMTLSSLNKESDSDDEEKNQAFYVGGSEHGGGQQVLGPRKDKVDLSKVFKSAQDHGAEVVSSSEQVPRNSGGAFSGSGYRLGDSTNPVLPSVPLIPGQADSREAEVVVKMYSNGFTVDDGPLRSLTDPESREFLLELARGRIPEDLLSKHKNLRINLNMENHSTEEWTPPKLKPFQGQGRMLGSPSPNLVNSAPSESVAATVPTAAGSEVTVAPPQVDIDASKPQTTLQIRLSNNSRIQPIFNQDVHTLQDIYDYVASASNLPRDSFSLFTSYPRQILDRNSQQTISQANITNCALIQKLD